MLQGKGEGWGGRGGEGECGLLSGQRIGLAVSRSLAVDDGVGVGREGSRLSGMPSRRCASSAEVF